MITSVFKKSTPLNFTLVVFLILVFFLIYQFQDLSWTMSSFLVFKKIGLFAILLTSVFISNFISKKNGLTKDSSYTILFSFLFLLYFPSIFDNVKILIANFFILLAFRRLISLQSLKASKEKIFDASLWIFIAALFHFWCILYIVLVFISIIFHVSRDYRNWILPMIALFAAGIIFMFFAIVFNIDAIDYIHKGAATNFEINYFTNNYQNGAFSIYATIAIFFLLSMLVTLSNKPLVLHVSLKKIVFYFLISVVVFLVSPNKSNDLLLLTIAPLAMMATSHIEMHQPKLRQEMVLVVLIVCSLFTFFSQL